MKAYKILFVAALVWGSTITAASALCFFGTGTSSPPPPSVSCNCGTKQTAVRKWNGTDCQTLCIKQGQLQHYLAQGWVQGCCPAARIGYSEPASLKIYPNPASDVLHVEFSAPADGKVVLSLLDASGRQLWLLEESTSGGFGISLPLNDLAAGMYYLRLITSEEFQVQKFIISGK